MMVLGISALYHDSAAALICDGEIVAAAQEERFTRIKHDASLPMYAIRYCMQEAGVSINDIEAIIYYDNPLLTAERFLTNLCYVTPDTLDLLNFSSESLFGKKLWIHDGIKKILGGFGKKNRLFVTKHHISHAASAFYPSPFQEAAILTIDGVGEYTTTALGYGKGNDLQLIQEIRYPHSLGLLYSAFTYFCGFKVNSGEYKLMGLAPYGEPRYVDLIKNNLIDIKADGSYRLNLAYFGFPYGRAMTNEKFAELFGGERRLPESRITRREMDIAASAQKIVEEVVLRLARSLKSLSLNSNNLVMAGGVALNCVANGVLQREAIFENIWIQPAAGDAGGALGAALYYYWKNSGKKRTADGIHDGQKGSYLGPSFSDSDLQGFLKEMGYPFHYYDRDVLPKEIAKYIAEQKVVGLFEGRMEFGPRALGNRSIVADPRSAMMQSKLNLKIKYRESFRPFAPSVLEEKKEDYFEGHFDSPYMLVCSDVRKDRRQSFQLKEYLESADADLFAAVSATRSDIPAVTHVDYSARLQTVSEEINSFYYRLIKAFEERTGCAVIINTSFNVRGEPIVCTPQDAYLCFMRTEMDVLVLGSYVLLKEEQPPWKEKVDWREQYELD